MFRLYDWQCEFCGEKCEEMVDVPHGETHPKKLATVCGKCFNLTPHEFVMPLVAPYMGERVLNPRVYGGQFDTMGMRASDPLPDLPGQAEHEDRIATKLSELPSDAKPEDFRRVMNECAKDAPSAADYSALFSTPEYREAEQRRDYVRETNKQKRARAKAMLRGENVNFRRDRCAGDPKMAG